MRVFGAFVGGFIVAVVLFYVMQALIAIDESGPPTLDDRERIDFVRVDRDEEVREREREPPEEPEEPEEPPPPEEMEIQQEEAPQEHDIDMDVPDFDVAAGFDGQAFRGGYEPGAGTGDGDVQPVVTVEPEWPREALVDGIEGWVRIEFTIREDGSVSNPRVVESEPGRLFDRQAIRAIQRWRFRPRVVDGRPVEREATQVIEFNLDDEGAQQ